MMALIVLVPAVAGAALAFVIRGRLRQVSIMTWLGWLMVGAGVPVLTGQVVALLLGEPAAQAAAVCEIGDEQACLTASLYFILPLTAGLCGGLGWAAGALSVRLTASRN